MASPTEKQMDYALRLANELTGERARYASQNSVMPKAVKTSAEASALIDDLQAAIAAHQKWQEETGLVIGAAIRRHYTQLDGARVIVGGKISAYGWSGLTVSRISVEVDAETLAQHDDGKKWRRYAVDRLSDEVKAAPVEELEAEREKLLARLAEVDAQLAALRS